jgi:5-methylcytosine-specific restriction endonuclease McrA
MSIIDKEIVLTLNAVWQPLGKKTVKEAIKGLCSFENGCYAFMALDMEYEMVDGRPDFKTVKYMNPLFWEDWIKLPIRYYDNVVHSAKMSIRVPTVIVSSNFSRMPSAILRPTKDGIRKRDNDTCQVSGKKLTRGQGNIDHNVPKSRGGKDTWENMVYMDKELNFKKGDKTLEEMGWKLLRKPRAPQSMPLSSLIREARHHDWEHFIIK